MKKFYLVGPLSISLGFRNVSKFIVKNMMFFVAEDG